MDFRIGDKVRVKRGGYPGTVVRVSERLKHPVLVEFSTGQARSFRLDEIEKVVPITPVDMGQAIAGGVI